MEPVSAALAGRLCVPSASAVKGLAKSVDSPTGFLEQMIVSTHGFSTKSDGMATHRKTNCHQVNTSRRRP
jgi:hypothetical protein